MPDPRCWLWRFSLRKPPFAAGSPGLTTHMLDTVSGKPAEGVRIDFAVLEGEAYRLVRTVHTNADGRNAEPLLTPETDEDRSISAHLLRRRVLHQDLAPCLPNPPFIEKAVIQFGMADVDVALSCAVAGVAMELHHLSWQLNVRCARSIRHSIVGLVDRPVWR